MAEAIGGCRRPAALAIHGQLDEPEPSMLIGSEQFETGRSVIDSPRRMVLAYRNRREELSAGNPSGQSDRGRRVRRRCRRAI
jgi:hypothetical protein